MVNENKDMLEDTALQDLFRTARAEAEMPRPELYRRVLADGQALLPAPAAPGAPRARRPGASPRLRAELGRLLGGWSLLAGLSAAMLAGLWIGYAHPGILPHAGPGGPMAGTGPGTGPGMGPGMRHSFELEDFQPGPDAFLLLLEDG